MSYHFFLLFHEAYGDWPTFDPSPKGKISEDWKLFILYSLSCSFEEGTSSNKRRGRKPLNTINVFNRVLSSCKVKSHIFVFEAADSLLVVVLSLCVVTWQTCYEKNKSKINGVSLWSSLLSYGSTLTSICTLLPIRCDVIAAVWTLPR